MNGLKKFIEYVRKKISLKLLVCNGCHIIRTHADLDPNKPLKQQLFAQILGLFVFM